MINANCGQYLKPFSLKLKELPGGFLIPVAILIAISFPPLFGHELVALLCGVVWGLWIGFAIVAAGTFLGERKLLNLQMLFELDTDNHSAHMVRFQIRI